MGNCLCRRRDVGPSEYRKITLDDFQIQRAIGKGAFGKVSVVQKRKGGELYALKYINKEKCIAEKAIHHVVQERNILEDLKHPFICSLRYSFQDTENMYMALDLMTGGDLRFHMTKAFKEPAARFILAEVSAALEYLHSLQIVHRDIKPDNILLDSDGHACLTDFNIAVKLRPEKPLKSVAGTEPYMAPELLLGGGYGASVDWWSLGVMAYEMLLGERPFRGKNKREIIKRGEWKFPKPPTPEVDALTSAEGAKGTGTGTASKDSKKKIKDTRRRYPVISDKSRSFISGLMTMDVKKRLGFGEEAPCPLRNHEFFSGIVWDKLMRKEVAPVFLPPKNKSNFDAQHDLEELLLNDNPLGTKPSKAKQKMEKWSMSPEMMLIERQFLYFDWSCPDFVDSQATHDPLSGDMDLSKAVMTNSSFSSQISKSSGMLSRSDTGTCNTTDKLAASSPIPANTHPPMAFRRAMSSADDPLLRIPNMRPAHPAAAESSSAPHSPTGGQTAQCHIPSPLGNGSPPPVVERLLDDTAAALNMRVDR
ncbi:kinase-like protein [Fimicolochytrium jonesii]|uniref:kinase-like protein n=1 Tax=Fimicolochytrium jonesii TaxID=1396493 RepID=UPI0022FE31CD|nr:kinase-like protein [Fimicolochytrium jonesii]KAI8817702.1 kinase-like protein [Fimicolochytrium jonesii]